MYYFLFSHVLSHLLSFLSPSPSLLFSLSLIPLSCLHLLSVSPTDRLLCNSQVMCWPVERP